MGLDMYLTGQRYIWSGEENDALRKGIQKHFKTELKPKQIEFEIIYWRKANAIHKWFVDNVQNGEDDCGHYNVSEEQLKALLNAVNRALESKHPEKILPTQEGFFFGGTEYDEYYRDDLVQTKIKLEKYLASEEAKHLDVQYHSSW